MNIIATIKNKLFGKSAEGIAVDEEAPAAKADVTPLITEERTARMVASRVELKPARSTTASRRMHQMLLDGRRTLTKPNRFPNRAARRFYDSAHGRKLAAQQLHGALANVQTA